MKEYTPMLERMGNALGGELGKLPSKYANQLIKDEPTEKKQKRIKEERDSWLIKLLDNIVKAQMVFIMKEALKDVFKDFPGGDHPIKL